MKQPKFQFNDRVDFVLRDDLALSGFRHHLGYVKRVLVKKRLLRKPVAYYDICEANRNERYLWCGIPERDIFGPVDFYRAGKTNDAEDHKAYSASKELEGQNH